jgi:hypothetical protein
MSSESVFSDIDEAACGECNPAGDGGTHDSIHRYNRSNKAALHTDSLGADRCYLLRRLAEYRFTRQQLGFEFNRTAGPVKPSADPDYAYNKMLSSMLNSTELGILSVLGTGDGTSSTFAWQGDDYDNRIGFTRHLLRDMNTKQLQLLVGLLNDDRFFWSYEQLRYMSQAQLLLLLHKYGAQRHSGGVHELSRFDGLHYYAGGGNYMQARTSGGEDNFYTYYPADSNAGTKDKREILYLDERPFMAAPASNAVNDGLLSDDVGFEYYDPEKLAAHRMWHTNLLTNYPKSLAEISASPGTAKAVKASDGGAAGAVLLNLFDGDRNSAFPADGSNSGAQNCDMVVSHSGVSGAELLTLKVEFAHDFYIDRVRLYVPDGPATLNLTVWAGVTFCEPFDSSLRFPSDSSNFNQEYYKELEISAAGFNATVEKNQDGTYLDLICRLRARNRPHIDTDNEPVVGPSVSGSGGFEGVV